MPLFRRSIPRRALVAAVVGFVYGGLLLPTGGLPMALAGLGWGLLAVSLLFAHSFAYYSYLTWALVWMCWRAVLAFQGKAGHPVGAAMDVLVPLLSIGLLSASGYLEIIAARDDANENAAP